MYALRNITSWVEGQTSSAPGDAVVRGSAIDDARSPGQGRSTAKLPIVVVLVLL